MDEEDGFSKDDLDRGLKEEFPSQNSSIVPIPIVLRKREIDCSSRSAKRYLEQWGEETFIKSQKSLLKCQLPGNPKSTFLMVFSPDGTKAASTHGDHNIYVTDIQTGKCICTLKGHPRTPWSVAFHPSSNEIIASGCLDGQVRVWDLKGGSEVWTPEKKHVIASLAFHPSDQVLVIATDHEIYFWDWFCPEPFAKISTGSIREKVKFVKFDPLGYKLITGIANIRHDCHRFETLNVASNIGGLSYQSPSANHRLSSCCNNRFLERYRSRFDRRDMNPSTTDHPNQAGPATSDSSSSHDNNFARIIQELTTGTRGRPPTAPWGSSTQTDSVDPILLNFHNVSNPTRTNNPPPPENEHRGELRNPVTRPVSDDSASSSSLDSSSSVTSGVSGASNERNTRLSLLWHSRLNRTGNDSDNSLGGGYDLEERRGEGSVMRREDSRRSGWDLPESFRTVRETPESRRSDRETSEASQNNSEARPNVRDILESIWNGSDREVSGSRRIGEESASSRASDNESRLNSHESRVHNRDGPESRLNENDSNGNNGPTSAQSRPQHYSLTSMRHRSDLSTDNNNDSGPLRCGGQRGRWMYYRGKFHGRNNTGGHTRTDQPRANAAEPETLATPGPSGISSRPAAASSTNDHSFQLYRNQSILDPHFGVQLLSRHIKNMQRICRSLSMPRAHIELTRHRHEINHLQQIRTMLYDIQHQIRSLRTSVDQTISEEFPSTTDQSRLQSLPSNEQNSFSINTLRDEDPEQVRPGLVPTFGASAIAPSVASEPSSNTGSIDSTARRLATRSSIRPAPRARHLSRLNRTSITLSSRIRLYRHNTAGIPWLVRRMSNHRRTTRHRLNLSAPLNNLNSDEVQITRTSVGMNGHRTRNSSRRPTSSVDRESRRRNPSFRRHEFGGRSVRRQPPISQTEPSSHIRQRHSADWQRRIRLAAHQQPSGSVSATSSATSQVLNNGSSASMTSTNTLDTIQAAINDLASMPSMSHNLLDGDAGTTSATTNSDNSRDNNVGLMEEVRLSYLAIQEQVNQLSNAINDSTLETSSSFRSPVAAGAMEVLASESSIQSMFEENNNNRSSSFSSMPLISSQSNSRILEAFDNLARDDSSIGSPERRIRTGPPTTALSTRIAAMLDQQESLRNPGSINQGTNTESAAPTQQPGRRMQSSVIMEDLAHTYMDDQDFFQQEGGADGDNHPFIQNLRSLRREIMQAHRHRMHSRRTSLVTGRDLAGATLDAINADRERLRADRRDRYRIILERMAERLNRLMNRSLLTHSNRLQQEIEQEFVELSGEVPNLVPPRSTTVSAALDNHMHNLRLLVRLALHLIYQLLNFICNQNISYEERPISRLPNPFREEEPSVNPSLDMELEPGLRNLTSLLETVRMASVELRNDVMEGISSRTSGRTLSSAVRRRLTNFLYRDYGSPNNRPSLDDHPSIHRPLPRSPMVIPQLLLNDLTMEGNSGRGSSEVSAPPSVDVPGDDPMLALLPPIRVLERQNAVDRLSPDLEDPSPAENEGGASNNNPPGPSQEYGAFASMGRHPFRFFPGFSEPTNYEHDRSSLGQNIYFTRPMYNQYVASRNIPVSFHEAFSPFAGSANPTHRIQAWDFSKFQLPDISDTFSNMVVPKCKIHFDASVCISDDGVLLAALIPEGQPITRVSVYSLKSKTLGQILYSSLMDSNTICVSISPTMKHLVVGIASYNHRLGVHANSTEKQIVASVYKIGDNLTGRNQALEFIRHVSLERDHRVVSLNCIRWMPFPGQGLIYGTNRGQLTIFR